MLKRTMVANRCWPSLLIWDCKGKGIVLFYASIF